MPDYSDYRKQFKQCFKTETAKFTKNLEPFMCLRYGGICGSKKCIENMNYKAQLFKKYLDRIDYIRNAGFEIDVEAEDMIFRFIINLYEELQKPKIN